MGRFNIKDAAEHSGWKPIERDSVNHKMLVVKGWPEDTKMLRCTCGSELFRAVDVNGERRLVCGVCQGVYYAAADLENAAKDIHEIATKALTEETGCILPKDWLLYVNRITALRNALEKITDITKKVKP